MEMITGYEEKFETNGRNFAKWTFAARYLRELREGGQDETTWAMEAEVRVSSKMVWGDDDERTRDFEVTVSQSAIGAMDPQTARARTRVLLLAVEKATDLNETDLASFMEEQEALCEKAQSALQETVLINQLALETLPLTDDERGNHRADVCPEVLLDGISPDEA